MDCAFCDSEEHDSKNCNKSDKEQKEIANINGFCSSCFVESPVPHSAEEDSNAHHSVFCPAKIKALKLFIPMIDEILLPRFLDMFDIDEKYSLITSSPSIQDNVYLKPVKIMHSFIYNGNYSDFYVIVANNYYNINWYNIEKDTKFYNLITSKSFICLPKVINIFKSKISSNLVLQLLSKYTKKLIFLNSSCDPNISFTDIIKKAPNLEEIYIFDFYTNILYGNLWSDDLLEYSNAKNFRRLNIKVDAIEDIDAEKLKKFARTKCAKNVWIWIHYDQRLMNNEDDGTAEWNKLEQIGQKLLQHFEDFFGLKNDETGDIPYLKIGFDGVYGYQVFSLQNAFKDK